MNNGFKLLGHWVMAFLLLVAVPSWAQQVSDPDLNDDGVVDILDISLVGGCFGQDPATNPVCMNADRDGDGVIGASDINDIVSHFGESGFPVGGGEDTTAPVVTIDSPVSDALFASPSTTVTGSIDDDTADVLVNGQAAVVSGGRYTASDVSLSEGRNIIAVTASDPAGNVGNALIQVSLDTAAPIVTVETPGDGAVLTSLQVDVAGLVNDIITGTTIDSEDCQVTVNGVEAQVSNRAWVVTDLLLQRGLNTLDVVATDRAGNTRHTSTQVSVQDQAGQRVVLLSGNNQTAPMGTQLSEPLAVTLLDADDNPVAGKTVRFEVSRGDGTVTAFPDQGSRVFVDTDDNGIATAFFTLGERMGAANQRVIASSPGFVGQVEFCTVSTPGAPRRITTLDGNRQIGLAGQPLPRPLVVLVTDVGGNPVGGVEVTYTIEQGGGSFAGQPTRVVITDNDGLAGAVLRLGDQEGTNNNVVRVTFDGLIEAPASFAASGRVAGQTGATTVVGVVLDNQDSPIPGVTIHLEQEGVVFDPPLVAVTDEQGRFSIANAPVGSLHLVADGSTTTRAGQWLTVSSEITTIAGEENTLGQPIWLLPQADNQVTVQTGGPEQEIKLSMPNVPGSEITIAPHSVTCPHGQSECIISWTQVRSERVPMEPPLGSGFMLAGTLQPTNTRFDPPVSLCIPNSDVRPGTQMEMFSFDHDLGEFVAIGTATVTEDGAQLCSDAGFGIVKAGWHGCAPPPPPPTCVSSCDDGNICTSDSCEDGVCVHTPGNEGNRCDDGSGCSDAICQAGACVEQSRQDNGTACDDQSACTEGDHCEEGACVGDSIEAQCDDGNECTDDSCDPSVGCINQNNAAACDDGDGCTVDDQCQDGACAPGEPKECGDDNSCTEDRCENGACINDPDPAQEGQKCDDGSICSDMICETGACIETFMERNGTECDDEDACTQNDGCEEGVCVGDEVDTSSWKDDASLTADVKVPDSLKSKIEAVINAIPGVNGVKLKEARVGVRGRARDCCDSASGVQTNGIKEASATGVLNVELKSIPIWGPPPFEKTYDFGVAIAEIVFDVGVRLDFNFRASGEIGKRFSTCPDGENCVFGAISGNVDAQPSINVEIIGCVETFWTSRVCTGVDARPAAIRFRVSAGGSFNKAQCGAGLDFFGKVGPVLFRMEFKSLLPGSHRIVFQKKIFDGYTLF